MVIQFSFLKSSTHNKTKTMTMNQERSRIEIMHKTDDLTNIFSIRLYPSNFYVALSSPLLNLTLNYIYNSSISEASACTSFSTSLADSLRNIELLYAFVIVILCTCLY